MDYAAEIYKAQDWWRNPQPMPVFGLQRSQNQFADPWYAYQQLRRYWDMRPEQIEKLPKDEYGNVLWQKTHKWTDDQINTMARAALSLRGSGLVPQDRQLTDENVFTWVQALTGKPAFGTELAGRETANVLIPTVANPSGIAAKAIAPPQRQANPWEAGRLGVMSNRLRSY